MRTKSSTKPDLAPSGGPSNEDRPAGERLATAAISLKQILVPIDFSECSVTALEYALALARKFEAKVTLLHVVEPAVYPENYLLTPSTLDEANQNLMASGRERLARLESTAKACGCPVDALVRMGRAQSEIPDTANATGTDLIVLGTHGHSGPKNALLGGTAERILRQAPCPVLTVRHPEVS
jgi:universal stress protein A